MRVDDRPEDLVRVVRLDRQAQQVIGVDGVAVGRRERIPERHPAQRTSPVRGWSVADDDAAGLVRRLRLRMRDERVPQRTREHHRARARMRAPCRSRVVRLGIRAARIERRVTGAGRGYHQATPPSSASWSSPIGLSYAPEDRYFHPPSGSNATIVPLDIDRATFDATARIAPDDGPAKMPSFSSSSRAVVTASRLDTTKRSSSTVGSKISGTNPSSSERRPWTASPGSGSAATIRTPGLARRRNRPTPVSVPPVPNPATNTSSSGTASRISGPVDSSCTRGLAGLAY